MISLRDNLKFEVSSVKQQMRKTNPILSRPKAVDVENVQNEPNFPQPEASAEGTCAKRSQTWRGWGMWAKAVVVWGVTRPGSETCKTNPIWPRWECAHQGMGKHGHLACRRTSGGTCRLRRNA
jgi:hypothetical protein